jgi:hypothetical protein
MTTELNYRTYSELPQEIIDVINASKLLAAKFPADPRGRVGVDSYYVEHLRRRLESAGFNWRRHLDPADKGSEVVA